MSEISYRYCHFPSAIVQNAIWLYCRFTLSFRDVEDLLAERGIEVSYETIRRWVARFGPAYAKRLRNLRPKAHPQWHLDEMFVSIGGRHMYLWRAVDQNGEVLDVLVQAKRDKRAALKLMRKLIKRQSFAPRTLVTDKLRAYAAAVRELGLTARHHRAKWKNNRIESAHVPIRRRERKMQCFRSPGSAQRFLSVHAAIYNTFNTRRHLISAPRDHAGSQGMRHSRWRVLIAFIALALGASLAQGAAAQTQIPDCRLDDRVAYAVRLAAEWGLEELQRGGVALPYDAVALNPRSPVPSHTLSIFLVKDAAASTVDERGCIRPLRWRAGPDIIQADGPCVGSNLDVCASDERQYMRRRFEEIHGNLIGDSQTGYELAGACYMTNLHACLHRHRLALLDAIGPRDDLSIKGTCVASARAPASIRCSAGALKMLLSSEAVAARATTVGMLLVIGHELGHLAAGRSSSYDAADSVIDLSWSDADKLARIRNQCRTGESLRQRERDADEIGLLVAKQRLPEIAQKWPKMGTTAWLITQAVHQSTNLTRWNNDWRDSASVETPSAFRSRPEGGVFRLDGDDIEAVAAGTLGSGRSSEEVERAARGFLCALTRTRQGRWNVLIQSGSTHGTMVERLGDLLGELRPLQAAAETSAGRLEAMLGELGDIPLRQFRNYIRELEGAICNLVKSPLECSSTAPTTPIVKTPPRATVSAKTARPEATKLPVRFRPDGSYREPSGTAQALTMALTTIDGFPSHSAALDTGRQMAQAYSALFAQITEHMRQHGGYWVHAWHSDVEVDYNRFTRAHMASIKLRAIARVSGAFDPQTVPALRAIAQWSRLDDVRVRPWPKARHEVVIHMFRRDTPGANRESQRVLTSRLRFDQIFDLDAAREGRPNEPAAFFRDLLPFLHERLQARFGLRYTLQDDHPPSPFYIVSAGLGDNFYLPAAWHPLLDSTHRRARSDRELAGAVDRVYINNSTQQDVEAIFGPRSKP